MDDRDRGLLHLSRGWKRTRANNAWGRTVVRASRPARPARMRFRGTQVALIGRKLAKGGTAARDGRRQEPDAARCAAAPVTASVLWVSGKLAAGAHTLRLRSLGGGPVELDAVAPLAMSGARR